MSEMSTSKVIPISVVGGAPVEKQVGNDKIGMNRAGFDTSVPTLRKPSWIRVRLPQGNAVQQLKARLRENSLVTVCEEASPRAVNIAATNHDRSFLGQKIVGKPIGGAGGRKQGREVFDVTGAGDTVLACCALAVASGASVPESGATRQLGGGSGGGEVRYGHTDAQRIAFRD